MVVQVCRILLSDQLNGPKNLLPLSHLEDEETRRRDRAEFVTYTDYKTSDLTHLVSLHTQQISEDDH